MQTEVGPALSHQLLNNAFSYFVIVQATSPALLVGLDFGLVVLPQVILSELARCYDH